MTITKDPGREGSRRPGFALVELAALMATMALVTAMVVVTTTRARRTAQLSQSLSNLRFIAACVQQYVPDNAGVLPSYSWRANVTYASTVNGRPVTYVASNDIAAAANQALDIIRRRADPAFSGSQSWIPHITFTHLVLADAYGLKINGGEFTSPGDTPLAEIQAGPPPSDPNQRGRFASSYEFPPAFFYGGETADGGMLRNADTPRFFVYNGNRGRIRARSIDELVHPSAKALSYEQVSRFFGTRQAFFMYPEARVPIAFFDGSVDVRLSGDANAGGYRSFNQQFFDPANMTYDGTSPPVLSGVSDQINGRIRWTDRLLGGRDFGPVP